MGFGVSIAVLAEPYWSGATDRPYSYAIDPEPDDATEMHAFLDWHHGSSSYPVFPTVVQAADAYVEAWTYWSKTIRPGETAS